MDSWTRLPVEPPEEVYATYTNSMFDAREAGITAYREGRPYDSCAYLTQLLVACWNRGFRDAALSKLMDVRPPEPLPALGGRRLHIGRNKK